MFGSLPQSGLSEHRRIMHNVFSTAENVFDCYQCNVKCKSPKQLEGHIKRMHMEKRKFPCTICSETFTYQVQLKRHTYIHSGEWPARCEVCQKGFYTDRQLNVHMNNHRRQWIKQGKEGIELFIDSGKNKKKKN
jgi:Zinc finger, C2H2 type/Zinc-finger of C2H2 type